MTDKVKCKDWDKIQAKLFKEPCLICGTRNKLTKHHLKTGKEIPLCRPCHDEVEEAKVYVSSMKSRKKAFNDGKQQERERILKLIQSDYSKINEYSKFYQKSKAERNSVLQVCEEALESCCDNYGSEEYDERDYEKEYDEKLVDKALKIIGKVK